MTTLIDSYTETVGSVDEGRAKCVHLPFIKALDAVSHTFLRGKLMNWGLEEQAAGCSAGLVLVRGLRCYH